MGYGSPITARARSYIDAFRDNPGWRKVYLARTVSLLGNWLNTLAIVHLLGEGQSAPALALAGVFVLKQLPVVIFGPAAGVISDRFDRRRIMIGCDLISVATVLGFLLTEPGQSHALIYVLTLMQMAVTTFFDPAYRAVVPDIVRSEDLVTVNALGAVTWSATFAAGTALGGVVLYFFGWRTAIVLDALTYTISAMLIARMSDPATAPPRVERPRGLSAWLGVLEMRDGLRYMLSEPPVRRIIVVKFIWGFMGALTLFLTILGTRPVHRLADSGDLGISFLWFSRAVGTGLGPLIARAWAAGDPRRLRITIAAGYAIGVCFYALLSQTSVWWLAGLWVMCAHVGGSMIWVMSTVLLQQTVPTELRGRTFAVELALVMLSSSLSHIAYGALLDFTDLGVRQAVLLAAAVCFIPALVWTLRVALPREASGAEAQVP